MNRSVQGLVFGFVGVSDFSCSCSSCSCDRTRAWAAWNSPGRWAAKAPLGLAHGHLPITPPA